MLFHLSHCHGGPATQLGPPVILRNGGTPCLPFSFPGTEQRRGETGSSEGKKPACGSPAAEERHGSCTTVRRSQGHLQCVLRPSVVLWPCEPGRTAVASPRRQRGEHRRRSRDGEAQGGPHELTGDCSLAGYGSWPPVHTHWRLRRPWHRWLRATTVRQAREGRIGVGMWRGRRCRAWLREWRRDSIGRKLELELEPAMAGSASVLGSERGGKRPEARASARSVERQAEGLWHLLPRHRGTTMR
jgi:hypothetical protein